MMDIFVSYLVFIGDWGYLVAMLLFFSIWVRIKKTANGSGLHFLQTMTFGVAIASLTVFLARFLSNIGAITFIEARAIAVINPIILIALGLYLNYLLYKNNQKK